GGTPLDDHVSDTNISYVVDDTCEVSSMADDLVHSATEDVSSEKNEKVQTEWEDPKVHAMKTSFVNVVSSEKPKTKVNFRSLMSKEHVDDTDCMLPVQNVTASQNKFANSLVMRDDDDRFYFKFTSITGLEQVLEQDPWMIRNQPLILNKWTPNLSLSKDEVTKVPVWVKIHKVHVVAYFEDGLSLIATQIGKPIMLDAFTSSMCVDPWGRIGFARALIEVTADKKLKQEITMVVPIVDGEGHTKERMSVEYEGKPPRCIDCQVFGHASEQCPKRVVEPAKDTIDAQNDGFTTNHFDALQDHQDDMFSVKELGESSAGNGDASLFGESDSNKLDSESEVEEVFNEYATKNAGTKGASTPSQDGSNV
ncbi:hypothetical protein Tco_1425818, partial [Tanacetum coccineum]